MASLAGELLSKYNDPQVVSTDTSGAIVSLNMAYSKERFFFSSAVIGAPKTLALLRDGRTTEFKWKFTLSGLHAITLPADFVMSDALFDDATKKWTPLDIGDYTFEAWWDGTNWNASITGPDN